MKTTIFLLFPLLFACGYNGESSYKENAAMTFDDSEAAYDIDFKDETQKPNSPVHKKVVKSGGINFQTKSVEKDYNKIGALLPKFGAYIENENLSKGYDQLTNTLTIRVPADQYDSLFNSIVRLANRLDHKYSNVEDVTERFYDLDARIKNKRILEERYLDLLKRATNVRDILEIERNLNDVRTEIEQMEGQFKLLNSQISLSTINLTFYEVLPISDDGYPRKSFSARILNSLNSGWQGFLSFLVGLVSLWPFVLVGAGVIYVFRVVRRKLKK